MPTAMRSSLIVVTLCVGLGAAMAAGEQGPGKPSTWSDPPARGNEVAKPTEKPPLPAAASAAQQTGKRKSAKAAPRQRMAERPMARRKARVVQEAPRVRQATATRHSAPMLTVKRSGPTLVNRPYPAYSAVVVPPDDEDPRYDRLRTAVPSGYLIMRRRTIEYPDGRTIRFYRPAEDDMGE